MFPTPGVEDSQLFAAEKKDAASAKDAKDKAGKEGKKEDSEDEDEVRVGSPFIAWCVVGCVDQALDAV